MKRYNFGFMKWLYGESNNEIIPTEPKASKILLTNKPKSSTKVKCPIGFSFAPAGLLFPYHFGVYKYLKDFGFLNSDTPLSGSSAGALIAIVCGLELDDKVVFKLLYHLEHNLNEFGTRGRLKQQLEEELRSIIDTVMLKKINKRPQKVNINYTKVNLKGFTPMVATTFKNIDDLIEVIIASCNIPCYLTTTPFVSVRGHYGIDGFFCDTKNFGCPNMNNVNLQVRILPFDASLSLPHSNIIETISPNLAQFDHLISQNELNNFLIYVKNNKAPLPNDLGVVFNEKIDNNLKTDSRHIFSHLNRFSDSHKNSKKIVKKPHNSISKKYINSLSNEVIFKKLSKDSRSITWESSISVPDERSIPNLHKNMELSHHNKNTKITSAKNEISFNSSDYVSKSLKDSSSNYNKILLNNLYNTLVEKSSSNSENVFNSIEGKILTKNFENSDKLHFESKQKKFLPKGTHMNWSKLLNLALYPASDIMTIIELFELGRADAFRWTQLYRKYDSSA